MALVAYGSSDSESDALSDAEDSKSGAVVLLKQKTVTPPPLSDDAGGEVESQVLFNALPKPKHEEPFIEEATDEFLNKKEVPTEKPKIKQAVKIGIPSLAEFDSDEEEPVEKKSKPSVKACGLFALLPPPRTVPLSTKAFVPNVLTRKQAPKPKPKPKVAKQKAPESEELKLSDNEDDEQVEMFDEETWNQVCGRQKKPAKPVQIITTEPEPEPQVDLVVNMIPDVQEPYDGLDNEAFKKLVGSGSLKRQNIKLVDVNEDEVMPDKDLWMRKALTDPTAKGKEEAEEPVNDTCKKKHHITYLAQQAKANEQELQNQWSQNKYARMQTSAKYGF